MRRLLRDNGLSIALIMLTLFSLIGHLISGRLHENEERSHAGRPPLTTAQYIQSGEFLETVFENWESEFLQMAMYVVLTSLLYQRGSAESRDPDKVEPDRVITPQSPWPVRRGGLWRTLYARSLSLALLALFIGSFVLHAAAGAKETKAASWLDALGTSKFWFESFQNWQSEFLSVAAMVMLSIWLRQRDSPESKDEAAPHSETGA